MWVQRPVPCFRPVCLRRAVPSSELRIRMSRPLLQPLHGSPTCSHSFISVVPHSCWFWDLCSQHVYLVLSQVFLRPCPVYLVVVNKAPSQSLLPRNPTCSRLEKEGRLTCLAAQSIKNNLMQPHQLTGGNKLPKVAELTGGKAGPRGLGPHYPPLLWDDIKTAEMFEHLLCI